MKDSPSPDTRNLLILAKQQQILRRTRRIAKNINASARRLADAQRERRSS